MGALFRFPAWIVLRTKNKKVAMIVKKSTPPPMIMPTMTAVFKLAFCCDLPMQKERKYSNVYCLTFTRTYYNLS